MLYSSFFRLWENFVCCFLSFLFSILNSISPLESKHLFSLVFFFHSSGFLFCFSLRWVKILKMREEDPSIFFQNVKIYFSVKWFPYLSKKSNIIVFISLSLFISLYFSLSLISLIEPLKNIYMYILYCICLFLSYFYLHFTLNIWFLTKF